MLYTFISTDKEQKKCEIKNTHFVAIKYLVGVEFLGFWGGLVNFK